MDELMISKRFEKLRKQLLKDRYRILWTETFEDLCFLHNYLVNHKKDISVKNELESIFYDILMEIFMPVKPDLEYQKYPLPHDGRFYYGAYDKIEKEVESLYDLNVYSPVWLEDLSGFYNKRSSVFLQYNFRIDSRFGKRYPRFTDQPTIRIRISEHLSQFIDPDKPLEPKNKTPESMYNYRFQEALYHENKVKNRFFQDMKYRYFIDLHEKKYTMLNLVSVHHNKIEEYDESSNELTSWIIKLKPSDDELISKYNLFKDNPFVYVFRYSEKEDIIDTSYNPVQAEFEGKITKIDEDLNQLTLKINVKDFKISENKKLFALVLKHDLNTYEREKNAVLNFSKSKSELKDLLIDGIIPKEQNKVNIAKYCNATLNDTQKDAVLSSLRSKSIYCIHGPPGTGKTKVCTEILMQFLFLNPDSRILVACASNEATDNIMNSFKRCLPSRLHNLILRVGTEEKTGVNPDSISYKVMNSPSYKKEYIKFQAELESNNSKVDSLGLVIKEKTKEMGLLQNENESNMDELRKALEKKESDQKRLRKDIRLIKNLIQKNNSEIHILNRFISDKKDELDDLTNDTRKLESKMMLKRRELQSKVIGKKPIFIFSTNSNSAFIHRLNDGMFDLLIIDEITQSTEPSSLIPINFAKKVIIAGDHHQLPPTVFLKNKDYDEEIDPNLERKRIESYQILSTSLFERLYPLIKNNPKFCIFLKMQYRMNPILVDFLNKTIYKEDKLESHASTVNYTLHKGLFGKPLVFVNHDDEENKDYASDEFSSSKIEYNNLKEVEIVSRLVDKYLGSGISPQKIGVISPYQAQVRKLTAVLEPKGLIAKTIDNFQGQEKDIIILSLVRSNKSSSNPLFRIGFLADERRFNVGITRFRKKLIIVGNKDTLTLSGSDKQEYYDIYDEENKEIYYKTLIDFIKAKGRYVEFSDLDSFLKNKVEFENNKQNKVFDGIDADFIKKFVSRLKV